MPDVSVIIATCNPERRILNWVVDSLRLQTLDPERFEVIIVDNNSLPPLALSDFEACGLSGLRLVRESRPGTTFARIAGILAAGSPLLVFADDDNRLDADYLEEALRIAAAYPELGAFGGIARCFSENPIPAWKQKLLPYLGVRDYGEKVITSNRDIWGEWEPIGAGMVFRRDVGLRFVETVRASRAAQRLGRHSGSFICGEDSLLARSAYPLGYSCSYQPSLRLTHFIRRSRLSFRSLARTLEGTARAYVIYEFVLGRPTPSLTWLDTLHALVTQAWRRLRARGLRAGLVEWFWDIGYLREARLSAKRHVED